MSDLRMPENPVRLYTNMVATLERHIDPRRMGELLTALRASGEERSLPVEHDGDVQRCFTRTGFLPSRERPERKAKLVEELVRAVAAATSRSPAQVSLILRLYASGMYGILPTPICGSTPRCNECSITKDCAYFNAPRKGSPDEHLPPAKRLARDSGDTLSDAELLALLLGGARPSGAQKDLAVFLLERFGSLRAIGQASYAELVGLKDITETSAVRIRAAVVLHERMLHERRSIGPTVRAGKDFYDIYAPVLRDKKRETFLVILLDQKNRILRDERVSEGTLTASLVHPREVFAPAIRESAAAIAFVHNHPSGDPTPSPEDRSITQRLIRTSETIGIRVLDHVIIGEGSYTSFVDEGLMK